MLAGARRGGRSVETRERLHGEAGCERERATPNGKARPRDAHRGQDTTQGARIEEARSRGRRRFSAARSSRTIARSRWRARELRARRDRARWREPVRAPERVDLVATKRRQRMGSSRRTLGITGSTDRSGVTRAPHHAGPIPRRERPKPNMPSGTFATSRSFGSVTLLRKRFSRRGLLRRLFAREIGGAHQSDARACHAAA